MVVSPDFLFWHSKPNYDDIWPVMCEFIDQGVVDLPSNHVVHGRCDNYGWLEGWMAPLQLPSGRFPYPLLSPEEGQFQTSLCRQIANSWNQIRTGYA
nr:MULTISPECIES: hypothetical protein [Frankia]